MKRSKCTIMRKKSRLRSPFLTLTPVHLPNLTLSPTLESVSPRNCRNREVHSVTRTDLHLVRTTCYKLALDGPDLLDDTVEKEIESCVFSFAARWHSAVG